MKNVKKLISLLLICIMLLPSVILPINAAENTESVSEDTEAFSFENLYETVGGIVSTFGSNGKSVSASAANVSYFSSTNAIAVNPGDKITFGPFPEKLYDYSVYTYSDEKSGTFAARYRIYSESIDAKVTGTIFNNLKIYTYTAPDDGSVKSIRLSFPQFLSENFLITRNYAFTAEEYFGYMKKVQGVDVSFLPELTTMDDPRATLENANIFKDPDDGLSENGEAKANENYCYCTYTDVTEGEMFYFIAKTDFPNKGRLVDVVYPNGDGTTNKVHKAENLILCESLGNGRGIFAYKVAKNVANIAILLDKTAIDPSEMLVTRNLRFNGAMYRKYLGIEITEQENLFDPDKLNHGFPSSTYGNFNASVSNADWFTTDPITVTPGSTITIGPIFYDVRNYLSVGYDETDAYKSASKIGLDNADLMSEIDTILGRARIYSYKVPDNIVKLRIAVPSIFAECTLITENVGFSANEYFAYMESKGINVDFLKPTTASAADATNYFDKNDGKETIKYPYTANEDGLDASLQTGAVDRDRTRVWNVGSGEGDLKVGDIIYAVALSYEERSTNFFNVWYGDDENYPYGYVTLNQGKSGNATALFLEDIGRGFGIYAVRVPEGATKVAVTLGAGNYYDGISFMTVNEPFSGESYIELFDIDLTEDSCDEKSPLNGLSGLFIGDSISNGSNDSKSYLDDPDDWRGWAGGIGAATGLISTNKSNSGAKISYSGELESADGDWIWKQQDRVKDQRFDIVVMQGGVNDAGSTGELGEILPVDTSIDALLAAEIRGTYLGGLQLLFASAKANWQDATLFFIANYKLSGNKATSGQREHLGEWFKQAEILCEMYGVHFIDLYNNEELKTALDIESDSRIYIHDGTHPNKPGYDIITPYIQREIEKVMCDESTHEFTINDNSATDHWTVCRYCGAENGRDAHIYDNNCDTTCNLESCGYVRTVEPHDFSVVDKNGEQHWKKCALCGTADESTKVDHVYDNACDTICNDETCGYEREITHDFSAFDRNGEQHWKKCALCGTADESTKADHVYDNACDTICNDETCGYEREITHDFSVTDHNDVQHWKKCSVCGLEQEGSRASHIYDGAGDSECDCGYSSTCSSHEFTVVDNDGTHHWLECSICGVRNESSVAEHNYSMNKTDETKHWRICSFCLLVEEGSAENHVYESVCDPTCDCGNTRTIVHDYCVKGSDATHHWEACLLCGAVDETAKEAHTFGEWVVTGDTRTRSCACGYSESEKIPVVTPPDDTTDVPGSDTPVDPGDDTTAPDGDDTTADLGDDTTEPDDDDTTADVVTDGDGTDADTDDEDSGCGSVIGGATA
ncbi:MAG: SGNH/GDSL hydrolase family protein, partial [Clostridia bacterium]|nr:SGNH/GDSL hydrolase family protein [Clostridia bacterium]